MGDEAVKSADECPGEQEFTPSERCIFCNKKLGDVGGRRIIAQGVRGIVLSDTYQGGGNKNYPRQSAELGDGSGRYVVVWGKKSDWTKAVIEKARNEFLNGHRPWFCQVCGGISCRKCSSPINYPVGTDVLYDDGSSGHCPLFPFNPGCSNPQCENYKESGWSR